MRKLRSHLESLLHEIQDHEENLNPNPKHNPNPNPNHQEALIEHQMGGDPWGIIAASSRRPPPIRTDPYPPTDPYGTGPESPGLDVPQNSPDVVRSPRRIKASA